MGFFFSVGNSAGLISSNVYPSSTGPKFVEGKFVFPSAEVHEANLILISGHSIAIGFSGMAIICALTLMWSNSRDNAYRDRVYGPVAPDGSDASPNKNITKEQREKWGLAGMSELEICELGDRHPGKA
jgi:hypothetical protein